MPGESEKGAFSADIPTDAIEEALRSVEKAGAEASREAEAPVEGAAEGGAGDDAAAERARLAAQLELSMQKGRETLEKLGEEHDRHLRAVADLENYKKRAVREREEAQKFGNERLLKDLIPVLDNLERALAAAPDGDPLAQGVRLVLRGFEETLGRHGVRAFSALGQPFDPRLHEAVMQVAAGDQPPGTVVMEHGRGFLLNDRLVRPAMVGVAAPQPPAASPTGDAGPAGAAGAGAGGNGAGGGETA
ncbi:MAG TPA: nucleotide exchange factor GrpE [Anaeromyxobacteraceae bacterium]|nr:nucleotide exchange factor GrpE [Anaeromyxobacteraceae bacterium]